MFSRRVVLVAFVLVPTQLFAEMPHLEAAQTMESISKERYIAGGVVGTLLGFGIGHAIQGRYKEIGWVFTLTGIVTSATWVTGSAMVLANPYSTSQAATGSILYLSGLILGAAFHIWETADIWAAPVDRVRWSTMLDSRPANKLALFEPRSHAAEVNVSLLALPF